VIERAPKLFVGVGNVLKTDDGVGVRAAEVMGQLALPSDVEVYDAGTVGIEASAELEGRDLVVVVDALEANDEPGAVFRFTPDQLRPYISSAVSLHDIHLLDALDETRLMGNQPKTVIIYAIQVADVSTGIGLSPEVEKALQKTLGLAGADLGLSAEVLENISTQGSSWTS
jgi:hydrogenase maturation protease